MTQAISSAASGAVPASPYGGSKASPASLQAQLQHYQQQLSDCVNCDSAKTPKGKSDIQAISAKISEVEKRIKAPDDDQQTIARKANQTAPLQLANATQGNNINVYA